MTDKNIYLIGFMGAGKSTAASALSKAAGAEVVEMDEVIACRAGMTIPEIFRTKGEAAFRQMETALLAELAEEKEQPVIVSCGGGAALRDENVRLMEKGGVVVLLSVEPETVLERIGGDTGRPVLAACKTPEDVKALMAKRLPYYKKAARFTVASDGRTPDEIAAEILSLLN